MQHHIYTPPGRTNRKYPFAEMAIGDHVIDHDARLSDGWRWTYSAAYNAAMAYQRKHPEYLFTGRLERDDTGQAIGVRITREHPALRSLDTMLTYLRDHVGHDAWKQGRELGLDADRPARFALINLREFTRHFLERHFLERKYRDHPLL